MAIEEVQTIHVNTIWLPVNNIRLGLEYIWAKTQYVNNAEGNLARMIFSAKYIF